jgi:hypothetical protein
MKAIGSRLFEVLAPSANNIRTLSFAKTEVRFTVAEHVPLKDSDRRAESVAFAAGLTRRRLPLSGASMSRCDTPRARVAQHERHDRRNIQRYE